MARIRIEADDLRQTLIVAKNEMVKCVRGRRFLAALLIVAMVFALITAVPYVTGGGWGSSDLKAMLMAYLSYAGTFAVLVISLVGSVAVVSEYEERTALILFTRPVKKTSILLGKFISAMAVSSGLMALYYCGVAAMTLACHGTVPSHLLESLCMCLMYVFAATGVAFAFSSVLKRSSVCIIFTILALLVAIPVATTMVSPDPSETWFMLDTAGDSVLTCVPEYVDSYNQDVDALYEGLSILLDTVKSSGDMGTMGPVIIQSLEQIIAGVSGFVVPIEYPVLWRDALVMLCWGAAGLAVSWAAFLRREF